jgi:hypothetical protein
MDDLRERFGDLRWRPMPDLWAQALRRAAELEATRPTSIDAQRVVVRPIDRGARQPAPRWWFRNPTMRALVVVALLAAALAATFAVGAWWQNRQTVVLPSDGPTASRRPFVIAGRACDGMRGMADLHDTYLDTNEEPSWTSGAPKLEPATPGDIAAVMLDTLSNVGVSLIDPATGDPCRLIDLRQAGLIPWEIRWSPNGSSLAMVTQLWGGSGEAHLLVWSDGEDPTFTRPWIADELPGIAWSPDGSQMAVAADRALTILAADGSRPRVLACDPCRSPTEVTWSPDGALLAIRTPGGAIGASELYVVEPDGGGVRRLDVGLERLDLGAWLDDETLLVFDYELDRLLEVPVDDPAAFAVHDSFRPVGGAAYVLSPDLTHAAYVANAQRSDEQLVAVDLVTGTATTLVRSASLDAGLPIGDVAWSPDGRSLAFTVVSSAPDGPVATGIWAIGIDGSGLRSVISGAFDLTDGRHLGSGPDLGGWRPARPG